MVYVYVKGIQLKKICPIYDYPFSAEYLNMWVVNERNCPTITFCLNNIDKKMVCFEITINNIKKMYVMPLLHM